MRKLFLEQRGFQEFSQANADLKNKKKNWLTFLSIWARIFWNKLSSHVDISVLSSQSQ